MNLSKEYVKNFVNRHRFSIAYAIMVISSLFLLPALNADVQGDVNHYQGIANGFFDGKLPYRDCVVEYPPYAVTFFLLPRIFGKTDYTIHFMGLAFVVNWVIELLLLAIGLRWSKTARALLPLLLYSMAIPFLHFFLLQRYDLYPALISLAAVWLFGSRRCLLCGLTLAIGIGVKLYPAVFIPPLFVLAMRLGDWKRFAIGLAAGLLPMALLSFYVPWWRFAEFQGHRGLQVECLYASALWLAKLLGLVQLRWVYFKTWYEIHGPTASALLTWARVTFIGVLGISTLIVIWAAGRFPLPMKENYPNSDAIWISRLARHLLVPLLAFVGFNQVLSPQYMIWLIPLAALASLDGKLTPVFLIAFATMLTPLIYPSLFGDYGSGLGLFETTILLVRNLILIIVWALLTWELWSGSREHALNQALPATPRVTKKTV
jgi:hypothetical protein